MAATIELLHEGGLQAVTIAAVAQRYGGSNGSIYHRFGDRTGLLMAAQEDVLTRIELAAAAAFSAAEQESDDDRAVQMLAEAALAVFAEHRGAMRAFFIQSRNYAPPPISQPRGSGIDRFRRAPHLALRAHTDEVLRPNQDASLSGVVALLALEYVLAFIRVLDLGVPHLRYWLGLGLGALGTDPLASSHARNLM